MRKSTKSKSSKSVKSLVKKELNKAIETKHLSRVSGAFDYVGDGVTTAANLINMTIPAQGYNDQQRIGNRITVKKIFVSKVFRVAQSQSAKNQALRVLVVQSRGGTLALSDMPNYWAPANLDKMLVIRDDFYTLSAGGSDYTSGNTNNAYQIRYQKKIPFNKIPHPVQQFQQGTQVSDRPIYLYMVAESIAEVEQAGFETTYFKDA